MAKTNVPALPILNHEGGVAQRQSKEQQLARSVMACLLWENTFYENGLSISERIASLVPKCSPAFVAELAHDARHNQKLRHVPLFLMREMARYPEHKLLLSDLIPQIISRADELAEFLALYWKDGKCPVSAQVKKGLAKAFVKFDEYALAKYNSGAQVKLRDVLFLTHAKPLNAQQADVWKRLVEGKLASPETWENRLSRGEDKKTVFSEMMMEKKLGALAFLRNLRNMYEAGVDQSLVAEYAANMNTERVLPFRFLSAARAVPAWEHLLEAPMLKSMEELPKMAGKTALLIDKSGSMCALVSSNSDLSRLDAAKALAILLTGVCQELEIHTFNSGIHPVPSRKGFALADAIGTPKGGTSMAAAIRSINAKSKYDRVIVVTDEQSQDGSANPSGKGYMVNVATYDKGVADGVWHKINGWSESVVKYICAIESPNSRA